MKIGPRPDSCFTTDDRDFSNEIAATARVAVEFDFVISGRRDVRITKHGGSPFTVIGTTHNVDCTTGADVQPPLSASPNTVSIGDVVEDRFLRSVRVVASAGNPFYDVHGIGLAPKIDFDTNFVFSMLKLSLLVTGTTGSFPAFEMYASVNGGTPKALVTLPIEGKSTAANLMDLGVGLNMQSFSATLDLHPILAP